MRYYSLLLTDPVSGATFIPSSNGAFVRGASSYSFSSHPNGPLGAADPGAPQVELDLPMAPAHTLQTGAVVRIYGVGLAMIGQQSVLANAGLTISGGMGTGLPLANPAQAGVLARSVVWQAFGNWQGVNQTLDLVCIAGAAPQAGSATPVNPIEPANGILFTWQPQQTLTQALQACLAAAYPAYQAPRVAVASIYPPRGETQAHFAESFEDFAGWLQDFTQSIGSKTQGSAYQGVSLFMSGKQIIAQDYTQPAPNGVIQLAFQDLIGQPTWIASNTISFKTVMRADIGIGDSVMFPVGVFAPYALTSPGAAVPGAPSRSSTVFQGAFTVTEIHHFGNFRQADADSWTTAYTAVPTHT